MQPSTPASQPASFIHQDGGRAAAFGDEPEQFRPQALLPASDAGTLRLIPACYWHGHLPDVHICWPRTALLRVNGMGHAQGARLPAVRRGLYYSSPSRPFCPKLRGRFEAGRASGTVQLSRAAAASDTMSIRQPVSLAASRAFWPSLPMARDSW